MEDEFIPALIVVDLQEDFCPPNGSLAVTNGRDVAEPINKLLRLPFKLKVATKDWHPRDHVSFAANHAGKQPYADFVTIVNPDNATESYSSRLWPVHCVQGTPGAELLPELDVGRLDRIINKGTDPRVEMYSPFYDPFTSPRVSDSGLATLLREHAVTDVYVVGLAGDYCVKCCAEDAAREGFRTYLIEECTRPVDAGNWPQCKKAIEGSGASVVSIEGPEVLRLTAAAAAPHN
ncbi:isochorismatase [Xylaria cf. heliscus]|nr:isochorismatase [Xylaria cf. heliscus]